MRALSDPIAADTLFPRLAPRWRRLLARVVGHILREDADLVTRWRARLTAAYLASVATFGLIPAIPAIATAIVRGAWPLAFLDATLLAATFVLLLSRRVSNHARNVFLTCASFAIGALSLWTIGTDAAGLVWLFTSAFMAAFLLGPRATLTVVVGIVGVVAVVGYGMHHDMLDWARGDAWALRIWMLAGTNLVFLVMLFAASTAALIRVLAREDAARTNAEAQLRRARHNEALGTLAGGIAHDFNNLLVPVLGNIEAVRQRLPQDVGEQVLLADAQLCAERARDLVRRILVFGRGLSAERQLLDPAAAAHHAIRLARMNAPPTINFVEEFTPVPQLRASEAELHQMLHNLVTNAVQAMGSHGTLTVRLAAKSIAGEPGVQFTVSDTGPGMNDTTRERIFDPFFTTKAPGQGTGLGLPIVHSVVSQLGGTIEVQSTLGVGTTFTIALPVPARTPLSIVPARLTPPAGTTRAIEWSPAATGPNDTSTAGTSLDTAVVLRLGTRVLLVDDEPTVRSVVQRLLEGLGCVVVAASDAASALHELHGAREPFAVLVTDYRMPGVSGVELARAAQRIQPDLPVVLVSGFLDAADHDTDGPPVDAVSVQKPFTRAALAEAMATAMRKARLAEHPAASGTATNPRES